MTPSPAPPPALPSKPSPGDAPVWGWVLLAGITLEQIVIALFANYSVHLTEFGPGAYVAAQVPASPQVAAWAAAAGWFGGAPLLILILLGLLRAMNLMVFVARYRVAGLLLLLGSVALVGFAALRRYWLSTSDNLIGTAPPTLDAESWLPGLAFMAASYLLAGLALWLWHLKRPRGFRRPSLIGVAGVAFIVPALGYLLINGRPLVSALDFGDLLPAYWQTERLWMQWQLAGHGLVLLGWLGLFLLAESQVAGKPLRSAIRGAWGVALLVAGTVAYLALPAEEMARQDGWPVVARGEQAKGTTVVWTDAGNWRFEATTLRVSSSSQMEAMIASGTLAEPTVISMGGNATGLMSLRLDPFAPVQPFLSAFRRSHAEYNLLMYGMAMAVDLRQSPLTDEEVDDWLALLGELPSSIPEDASLLGNLVGSGRKERAEKWLSHIRDGLGRLPSTLPPPFSKWDESQEDHYARYGALIDAYEAATAKLPPSDGLARSVRIKVVSATGTPLVGVPVGLYQTFRLLAPEEVGGEVAAAPPPGFSGGRYLLTDSAGEALFIGLCSLGFGQLATAPWPSPGGRGAGWRETPSPFRAQTCRPLSCPVRRWWSIGSWR